jgi:hypothetical protein
MVSKEKLFRTALGFAACPRVEDEDPVLRGDLFDLAAPGFTCATVSDWMRWPFFFLTINFWGAVLRFAQNRRMIGSISIFSPGKTRILPPQIVLLQKGRCVWAEFRS